MVQNWPMWVTYSGRRAKRRSPIGPVSSGVQGRLGFREGNGSLKDQKKMAYSWFKTSLTSRRAGSRRDVTESYIRRHRDVQGHVAT